MKRVIGVTGGVGSGKSQVLAILSQDFNARVILADEVAHSLMEPGEKGYCQVIAALGTGFLKPVPRAAITLSLIHISGADWQPRQQCGQI